MYVGPDLDPNCLILKLRFVQQKISPIRELSVLSGAKLCFVCILTFMYNPFLVYCRELAPGTVNLTGVRAQGDDSKHDSHYSRLCTNC